MSAEFNFTLNGQASRTVLITSDQYARVLEVLEGQPDEARERQRFEDACYAHYLTVRAERSSRGVVGVLDTLDAPHPRELLFQRNAQGEYEVVVYQHAWGGWMLARKQ